MRTVADVEACPAFCHSAFCILIIPYPDLPMGIALTTLACGGALILLFQTRAGYRVLSPLVAIGRAALTVYIGQHVVAATLFQGWGMGWGNRPGLGALVPLVLALYLTEVLVCNAWLARFRFGPLEWVWRSLTYGRLQPMRRRPAS